MQQPDAQLQLVEWLIWDGQYDKAKMHFTTCPLAIGPITSKRFGISSEAMPRGPEQAQSIEDPIESLWTQGLIAVATENRALMRQAFDQLSQSTLTRQLAGCRHELRAGHAGGPGFVIQSRQR